MAGTWVRRPLVGVATFYLAGTALGLQWPVASGVLPGLAALGWLVAVALLIMSPAANERGESNGLRGRRSWLSRAALLACAFLCAWSAASLSMRPQANGDLSLAAAATGRPVRIAGVVQDDYDSSRALESGVSVWSFPLRVEEVETEDGGRRKLGGQVTVLWYGDPESRVPAYGERWELTGRLAAVQARPGRLAGPPRQSGDRFTFSASRRDARLLSAGHGAPFKSFCLAARRAAAGYLSTGIEDHTEAVNVLQAIMLGYRSQLSREMRNLFVCTGTLHIFAISGLHVVVVALIFTFIPRALRISRVYWVLFLGPLVAAYTVATGAAASAVRACVMAIVFYLAPLLGRKADTVSALALSALVIVGWSPVQLCDRGFILSFVAVLGLVVFYPPIEQPLRRIWEVDPLREQPEERWVSAARWVSGEAMTLLAISLAAWLATSPLSALFFGRFTPVAILANLFVVPVSSLVVIAGSLAVLAGPISPFLADLFNHANVALIGTMVRAADWMTRIPFGNAEMGRPPAWVVWVCYAGLGALALWLHPATGDSGNKRGVEEEEPGA